MLYALLLEKRSSDKLEIDWISLSDWNRYHYHGNPFLSQAPRDHTYMVDILHMYEGVP